MLRQFSNPEEVKKKARYYNLNTVYESTRRNKKYMVCNDNGKFIHFGAMGYSDFTKNHDKARLEAFRRRNWRWQYADIYTPRWLSYFLLWD